MDDYIINEISNSTNKKNILETLGYKISDPKQYKKNIKSMDKFAHKEILHNALKFYETLEPTDYGVDTIEEVDFIKDGLLNYPLIEIARSSYKDMNYNDFLRMIFVNKLPGLTEPESMYEVFLINYENDTKYETKIKSQIPIYSDDSIEELKYKISTGIDVKNLHEYYLFYEKQINLKTYQEIKKYFNKSFVIEGRSLKIFAANHNLIIENISDDDSFTMDELIQMDLPNIQMVLEPLGLIIKEKIYSVNPFLYEKKYNTFSDTQSNLLLLEFNIHKIYLVLASDLIKYSSQSIKDYSKVFFPYIYNNENFDLKKVYSPDYNMRLDSIVKQKNFYKTEIFNNSRPTIKSLSFILYPKEDIYIPIDLLFKTINSKKINPLIQLNLEKEQEILLRLYTNEYSKNNMSIPYLSKKKINMLTKTNGKKQTIHIYFTDKNIDVMIELNRIGQIMINIKNNTFSNIYELEEWIENRTKTIIHSIIKQFDPLQSTFRYFTGFSKDNVEIMSMNYEYNLEVDKKLKLSNIKSYFNNIFNYDGNDSMIKLKFIKVSNYIESDNIRTRIIHLLRENYDTSYIITNLTEQFDNITKEIAEKKISEVYEITDMKEGVRQKKRNIISPGIDIIIKQITNTTYTIEVSNINNYKYIEIIELYLSNLIYVLKEPSVKGLNEVEEKPDIVADIRRKSENKPIENDSNSLQYLSDEEVVDLVQPKQTKIEEDTSSEEESSEESSDESERKVESDEDKPIFVKKTPNKPQYETSEESGKEDKPKTDEESDDLMLSESEEEVNSPKVEVVDFVEPISPKNNSPKKTEVDRSENEYSSESEQEQLSNNFVGNAKNKSNNSIIHKSSDDEELNVSNELGGANSTEIKQNFKNRIKPLDKLKKTDPKIFSKTSYARKCDWGARKQPIVLSQSEKSRIDKIAPGSYKEDEIMEIRNNHYMCPLYWDFERDVPIRKEEIDEKKLHEHIFTSDELPIPKDKYIFQIFKDEKGKQKNNKIGFLDIKKNPHPDNMFMPCCFSTKTAPFLQTLAQGRKMYEQSNSASEEVENVETKMNYYIQDRTKVPLDNGRLAHLTGNLSSFFGYDSAKYFKQQEIIDTDNVLLRQGTYINKKDNSFLIAIGKIFGYTERELIKKIISVVNLDTILQFSNGKLPSVFYNKMGVLDESKKYKPITNIKKYEKYNLFKQMENNTNGLLRIINGLENFHLQLYQYMDYIYLWDIITSGLLFKEKPEIVNLIIINDINDSTTNKIEILCPSSDYSDYLFNTDLYNTIILYRYKIDYQYIYEPIIQYNKYKKINPFFNRHSIPIQQMNEFLEKINIDKCRPTMKYDFGKKITLNITLKEINDLLPFNYSIKRQIMNYNGQVIGGLIEDPEHKYFYLPCRPTNIMKGMSYSNFLRMIFAHPLSDLKEKHNDPKYIERIITKSRNLENIFKTIRYKKDGSDNYNKQLLAMENISHKNILKESLKFYESINPIDYGVDRIEDIQFIKDDVFDKSVEQIYKKYKDIKTQYVKNKSIFNDYKQTLFFLKKLKHLQPKILCEPRSKIISNSMIVGIITETNQYIHLSKPLHLKDSIDGELKDIHNSLDIIDDESYLTYDQHIIENHDEYYFDNIFKLKLEERFYSMFFQKMKIVLSDLKHFGIKRKIINTITSENTLDAKVNSVKELLLPFIDMYFIFSQIDKPIIKDLIDEIHSQFDYLFLNDIIKKLYEMKDEKDVNSIIQSIKNDDLNILEKLTELKRILSKNINNFDSDYKDDIKEMIYEIGKQIKKDDINRYTKEYTDNYCLLETPDGKCIIPETNLYSETELNYHKYIQLFTESIIRNHKIYNSLFYDSYTINPYKNYNINKDEILIYKTNINDYFSSLNDINKYKIYYEIDNKELDELFKYAQENINGYHPFIDENDSLPNGNSSYNISGYDSDDEEMEPESSESDEESDEFGEDLGLEPGEETQQNRTGLEPGVESGELEVESGELEVESDEETQQTRTGLEPGVESGEEPGEESGEELEVESDEEPGEESRQNKQGMKSDEKPQSNKQGKELDEESQPESDEEPSEEIQPELDEAPVQTSKRNRQNDESQPESHEELDEAPGETSKRNRQNDESQPESHEELDEAPGETSKRNIQDEESQRNIQDEEKSQNQQYNSENEIERVIGNKNAKHKDLLERTNCVIMHYLYTGSVWKQYFPTNTKHLRINTTTNDCNYLLLNYIFKLEGKDTYTKEEIQQLLSNSYRSSTLNFIQKLNSEGKKIKDKEELLTKVIETTYPLTLTDMMILCDTYKLPVTFCRAKKIKKSKAKIIRFYRTTNMINNDYSYYIRVVQNHFDLFHYRETGIKIYYRTIESGSDNKSRERKRLHNLITPITLNNYIHNVWK